MTDIKIQLDIITIFIPIFSIILLRELVYCSGFLPASLWVGL